MGMLGFRPALLITLLALVFYAAWGLGNGFVTWKTPTQACYGGYKWVTAVDKQPFLSIGKLTLLYQPWSWTCEKDHLYDPQTYKVENGVLVPRNSSTNTYIPASQP